MLTDARSNDYILFSVTCLFIELFDDFLWLDTGIGTGSLHIGEGILLFPLLDVRKPFIARRRSDQGDKDGEIRHDVAENWDGSFYDFVDVLWLNLKMDDATASLGCCRARSRCKRVNLASDTIIESSTQGDDQIGILHCKVGISRTVHTEHVQALLVGLVKGTKALQSGGDGNVALLGKLSEQLGSHGRRQDSLTGIDDRPLCLVDQTCSLLDEDDVGRGSGELQGICRQGVRSRCGSLIGQRCAQNPSGNVLGEIY